MKRLRTAALIAAAVLFSASCARAEKTSVELKNLRPSSSIRDRIPINISILRQRERRQYRWLGLAVPDSIASDRQVILNPVYGTETDYANKISLSLKSDASIDVVLFDGALLNAFIGSGYRRLHGRHLERMDLKPARPRRPSAQLDWAMPISLEVRTLL